MCFSYSLIAATYFIGFPRFSLLRYADAVDVREHIVGAGRMQIPDKTQELSPRWAESDTHTLAAVGLPGLRVGFPGEASGIPGHTSS